MPVGFQSPEDVCNAALREVGYSPPIADIYEGSRASLVAVDVYATTRDALLHEQDWDFGYREEALEPSVGAPVAGFTKAYVYPADCLRIRYIRPQVIPAPNNNPAPVRWLVYNDLTLDPPVKSIACSLSPATINYEGQITAPTTWNPAFTRALVRRFAEIFAFALRDDINLERARVQLSDQAVVEAAEVSDAMGPAVPEIPRGGGQRGGQPQG